MLNLVRQGCRTAVWLFLQRSDCARRLAAAQLICVGLFVFPNLLTAQVPSFFKFTSNDSQETNAAQPEETLQLKIRIAWGGGKMKRWLGSITISDGSLKLDQLLGMEADEARAIQPFENTVYVGHLTPRDYDGIDLSIEAPASAKLLVQLQSNEATARNEPLQVPLSELISGNFNTALDDQGNLLLIKRAPGDIIRAEFQRDHLVFEPGEDFTVSYQVYRSQLTPGKSVQFKVQVLKGRTEKVEWEETVDATIGPKGSLALTEPFDITLPEKEGVYDIQATISEVRISNLVFAAKPLLQRKIQVVVIDPEAKQKTTNQKPELIVEFDPANPSWWNSLSKISQYNPLQLAKPTELNNGKSKATKRGDKRWTQLDQHGWHAYPLAIDRVNQPHILEIEYPGNVPQTLGISLVDLNSAKTIAPIGLDSGLIVPESARENESKPLVHRLVFWPKSENPFVLFTNRVENQNPAIYGKIRVFSGQAEIEDEANHFERRTIAYYDKPLFAANFCATEDLNRISNRSLEDWKTFYDGAERLTKHLRYSGYNSASISVLSEGGSLYPSQLISSTPKYDRGPFFIDGRDPLKKDILEMMFRQFNKADLLLIPAIELSTPLEELEQLRLSQRSGAAVDLVNSRGEPFLESIGHANGKAAYYNPLRPEVQNAIHQIVFEIVSRYGHHPSFGGINLQLDANGFGQMPGVTWGMDRKTVSEFLSAIGSDGSRILDPEVELQPILDQIIANQAEIWIKWRAERLNQLHRRLAATIQTANNQAILYLNTAHSFQGPKWQKHLMPSLPQAVKISDAFLEIGLDLEQYQQDPRICLIRTNYLRPIGDSENHLAFSMINSDRQINSMLRYHQQRGMLNFHVPDTLRLAEFDQVTTVGSPENYTWLATHFQTSGEYARRSIIHSLVEVDSTQLLQGGWMLPLGQETHTAELLRTIQKLPAKPFQEITLSEAQPVVIRQWKDQSKTYLYFANPTPWPVTLKLTLSTPNTTTILPLGKSKLQPSQAKAGTSNWTIQIEPFDLLAVTASTDKLNILDGNALLIKEDLEALRQELESLRLRILSIRSLEPSIVLNNPGFEIESMKNSINSWTYGNQADTVVTTSTNAPHQGKYALKLASQQSPLWLRSELLDLPRTGRIKLRLHMRNNTQQIQPPIRLAIDGSANGQNVYQIGSFGLGSDIPIPQSWQAYEHGFSRLPPMLKQFKVGVDLMGRGDISIDSVEVYPMFLTQIELNEMNKMMTLLFKRYQQGAVGDCRRILDSYWPQYLKEHVTLDPQLVEQIKQPLRSAALPERKPLETSSPPSSTPSRFQWLKDHLPSFN